MSKLRPSIRNLLKGNPSIFHYTSFETADQLFSQHPIWQQARIESERRELFLEYLTELQNREQVGLFSFHCEITLNMLSGPSTRTPWSEHGKGRQHLQGSQR